MSRRWKILLAVLAGAALLFFLASYLAYRYARSHAEPVLRARIVQALATRFNSQVELGEFDVQVDRRKGLGIEGKNLSLRSNLYPDLPPQIRVDAFRFHAGLFALFRSPMHIQQVELSGLSIVIPPKGKRAAMPKMKKGKGKIKVIVDRIVCKDAVLEILNADPQKPPMEFDIHALTLTRAGSSKPMHFQARLVNPRPIGDIATEGNFGPWNADHPHDTHLEGNYAFTNADLSTTKGIAGMLSSTGKFTGPLDTLAVDGTTDTPDFSVDVSGHPVDLRTEFHAIVDGTNGNTYLQPVRAQFLHTRLTAEGYVVRASGPGHNIVLNVTIDQGRVEDLLLLGAKTMPPVMNGGFRLKTKFDLPAGKESVSRRLRLKGTFDIDKATFTNAALQRKIDELSLRSQGHARQAKELAAQPASQAAPQPDVTTSLHGDFALASRKLTLLNLVGNIPGAEITLAGTYTLDGKEFDFTGHARMDAHLSSMVGGWKGKLLTPADPFFARHGAGTEVPIKITGTKSNPQFGLNFHKGH